MATKNDELLKEWFKRVFDELSEVERDRVNLWKAHSKNRGRIHALHIRVIVLSTTISILGAALSVALPFIIKLLWK